MKTFEPITLSIKELFGNQDSLYKIPKYQRPYKWGTEQVEQLWEDLYTEYQHDADDYFLGSIITTSKDRSIEVVDGQQRMTTLMILCCVVRDLFPNLNENSTDYESITSEDIHSFIYFKKQVARLTLLTRSEHRTDFEKCITSDGATLDLKKPTKKQLQQDNVPKYKFINTALIFKERLKELSETEVNNFVSFIFNQVSVIRIKCVSADFAIKLFQVLNDRGMDLSASDLIKSFLLQKIEEKYKGDPDAQKEKEEQFISDWLKAEEMLANTDINFNDMLVMYEYCQLAQNPKKSLSDEMRNIFKDRKDANEIVQDLVEFCGLYRREIFNQDNKDIYALRYLRWSYYWKSILLAFLLYRTGEDYQKLIVLIRRFYYLYWISGKTLTKIKQISFNLIKWIKAGESLEKITTELEKKIRDDNIVQQAIDALSSSDIYNTAWCKPLLLLIEYSLTDESKMSFIDMDHKLHVEHIIPKEYSKVKGWNFITSDIAEKWLNSCANLTLLSGSKNIEASNDAFDIKMNVYRGKGKYENKAAAITAFEMTRRIVSDFDTKKFGQQWNEDALKDRYQWFKNNISILFQIDLPEKK